MTATALGTAVPVTPSVAPATGTAVTTAAFAPAGATATVAAVVVTYNNADHLDELLLSLRTQAADLTMRVVVVDSGSTDSTVERARDHGDVMVVPLGRNVGYAAAINRAGEHVGAVEAVLVLNADLVVAPGAVTTMLARLRRGRTGIVLPRLVDERGALSPSLRREPTVTRSLGDTVLGPVWLERPAWLSETVRDPHRYAWAHATEWGTGAAMLVRTETARRLGPWDERFFLYSEETDYCRRAREAGWEVWYEPAAEVRHVGAGSGQRPDLTALLQVNRVRYARKHRGGVGAAATYAATTLHSASRTWDPGHRAAVGALVVPARRRSLPAAAPGAATVAPPPDDAGALRTRVTGSLVIPVHDEEAVLARTLAPVAPWAVREGVEVVVVCNGCTDRSAEIARSFPGVTVVELEERSKAAALNAGDAVAQGFPRAYLDADVQVDPRSVEALLRTLHTGSWLAGRPPVELDLSGVSWTVRAFYRARHLLPTTRNPLWGAGIYALTAAGHARLGRFPSLLADDLWVDELFTADEKMVVDAPPVRVAVPRTVESLLGTLRRSYRGNAGVRALRGNEAQASTVRTLLELFETVRGPRSAVDALVYATLVAAARLEPRGTQPQRWERDETARR